MPRIIAHKVNAKKTTITFERNSILTKALESKDFKTLSKFGLGLPSLPLHNRVFEKQEVEGLNNLVEKIENGGRLNATELYNFSREFRSKIIGFVHDECAE